MKFSFITCAILFVVVNFARGNTQGEKLTDEARNISYVLDSDSGVDSKESYEKADAITELILENDEQGDNLPAETDVLNETRKDEEVKGELDQVTLQKEEVSGGENKVGKENQNKNKNDTDVLFISEEQRTLPQTNIQEVFTKQNISSAQSTDNVKTNIEDAKIPSKPAHIQQKKSKHVQTHSEINKAIDNGHTNRQIVDKNALLLALKNKQTHIETDKAAFQDNSREVEKKMSKGHYDASQQKLKKKHKISNPNQEQRRFSKASLHLSELKKMDHNTESSNKENSEDDKSEMIVSYNPLPDQEKESEVVKPETSQVDSGKKKEELLVRKKADTQSILAPGKKRGNKKENGKAVIHHSTPKKQQEIEVVASETLQVDSGEAKSKEALLEQKTELPDLEAPSKKDIINTATKKDVSSHYEPNHEEKTKAGFAKLETIQVKTEKAKEIRILPKQKDVSRNVQIPDKSNNINKDINKDAVPHNSLHKHIKKITQTEAQKLKNGAMPKTMDFEPKDDLKKLSGEKKSNDFHFENEAVKEMSENLEKVKLKLQEKPTIGDKMTLPEELQKNHSTLVVTVSLTLIVSIILLTLIGAYFRQISYERRRYVGHLLLQSGDEDELPLFNRETYHDEAPDYSSWHSFRG